MNGLLAARPSGHIVAIATQEDISFVESANSTGLNNYEANVAGMAEEVALGSAFNASATGADMTTGPAAPL